MSNDQVWKIILFPYQQTKNFFSDLSRLENDQNFFRAFSDSVESLRTTQYY